MSALYLLLAATLAGAGAGGSPPAPPPPASPHLLAVTFDDLPYVAGDGVGARGDDPARRAAAAIEAERRIVAALNRAHVPATGFVNEEKVQALGSVGVRLLQPWNRGRLALGNHGYSHADSNLEDIPAIEGEIVRGEATIRPMAAAAGRRIPFFRFPYNHVGDTEPKRVAIEATLARHGYRLAASTIDTSDYLFNNAFERAYAAGDRPMMERILRAYFDYSRVQIAYYDRLDRQVLGRDAPAIILLHANRLNAAAIRPLLTLISEAGYRFVSLDQAQSDPAYAAMPAVATPYGPMWGYRWAKARGVKVDGRLEQDPPAWITAYARRTAR